MKNVALTGHPFGFLRFGVNIFDVSKSKFSKFTASSKVSIIICGVCVASIRPGIIVPSFEQKQSGNVHTDRSHVAAALGSLSASHHPSSLPSGQSTDPSQKYSFGKHVPSAHASWLLSPQLPSSSNGFGIFTSEMVHRQFILRSVILPWIVLTSGDLTVVHILFEIAYLSRHIEQQPNGTFELKHLAVQTQIIFGTFGICPHFVRRSIRVPVKFRIFQTCDRLFETPFHQIAGHNRCNRNSRENKRKN